MKIMTTEDTEDTEKEKKRVIKERMQNLSLSLLNSVFWSATPDATTGGTPCQIAPCGKQATTGGTPARNWLRNALAPLWLV